MENRHRRSHIVEPYVSKNCPPSHSSPAFSCSLTFGRMCPHQVDPDLQWFPHKSDEPVYRGLPRASLSAWPVCFIRWIHFNRLYLLGCNAKARLCPCFPTFMSDFCPLFRTHISSHCFACNELLILPVVGDAFVISVADRQIFLFGSTARSWSVLSEVGKTSIWLSPLSWACCFGRTSLTGEDRPWVQPPAVITAWPPLRKRDSRVAHL